MTPDQLNTVERYASQFFSYKEIALLMRIDVRKFIEKVTDENSDIYKAYHRGKLLTESDIRASIIKMAKLGSAVAQNDAMKLIKAQKTKEITHG